MAFFSEIPVNRDLPLPPPDGAEKVTLRYQTRRGLVMESAAPLYRAAAYRRAKDLLAAGYTVWYKDVLTYEGVQT